MRPSYITLSSAAPGVLRGFYEALGLVVSREGPGALICFSLGPLTLALYPAEALSAELGVALPQGGLGRTLISLNVDSAQEVDAWMARAQAAGARITRPAERASWGGYRGYFLDPEGNPWELVFNPRA